MKPILILLMLLFVACNTIQEKSSVNKPETLSDSGFTNKSEAKNLMVNGLKEGKWMEDMDTNYKVVSDTSAPYYALTIYRAGKEFGIAHGYYKKSGKLLFETHYSDGQTNGSDKGYYENGKVMYEANCINGKLDGVYKEYYENGKIELEAPFKDDSENGIEKDYDTNGVLEQETPVTYSSEDSININGLQKEYYESGKLKEEIPYVNNKMNGLGKRYYESGKLKSEVTFINDKEVATKNFNENGKEIR